MHTKLEKFMEEFNLDMSLLGNDLSAEDLDFSTEIVNKEEPKQKEEEENLEEQIIENPIEGLTAEDLNLESVGGEPEKSKGNTIPSNEEPPSPDNTYSSIASAFKVDGVPLFSEADDEELKKISSVEDFEDFLKERLEKAIDDRFDDSQKRIKDALTYGMEPSDIQVFENSLRNLNSITEEAISDESEDGEKLRRQLIYSDFINRGISKDRAEKLTQRAFDAGTDLDDAKEALKANKEFYKSEYDRIFKANKDAYEANVAQQKKAAEDFKKVVISDKKAFGEVEVDSKTRQKIYDVVTKPVAKDKSGNPITEIQKYADENPADFRKYLAYFYVITDGFKSLQKVKDTVSKEVRKKEISALERTLNSSQRNSDGSLKFMGNTEWGSDGAGDFILL